MNDSHDTLCNYPASFACWTENDELCLALCMRGYARKFHEQLQCRKKGKPYSISLLSYYLHRLNGLGGLW
jgi:hypothetical protein